MGNSTHNFTWRVIDIVNQSRSFPDVKFLNGLKLREPFKVKLRENKLLALNSKLVEIDTIVTEEETYDDDDSSLLLIDRFS